MRKPRHTERSPREEGAATPEASASETVTVLMDATERLLVSKGHAGISTRAIAEEAGLAHGLIRYHFGSLEELMLRTLERASSEILTRQRAMYAGDEPFLNKWRTAMQLFEVDLEAGFPKVFAELMAKAWNEPVMQRRLQGTMAEFAGMLEDAVQRAVDEYGTGHSKAQVRAIATLVRTFQLGMLIERLTGIDTGHEGLLAMLDDDLRRLAARRPEK